MFLKRKILSLAMLIVMAAPVFFFAYFVYARHMVQQEMKEKLEKASLQHITIPLAGVHWIKEGKEVLVDGKYFDVKSFVVSGRHMILTGLFDSKEDELHRRLTEMTNKKGSNTSLTGMNLFSFFPVYTEASSALLTVNWQAVLCSYLTYTEKIPAHHVSDITHPPGA